jgi:hypothetical protein
MILTNGNYYSQEANLEYMSVSQYKDFFGTLGYKGCEAQALAKLKPLDANIYTVVQGDTLWGISRRYGLTVDALCKANNITENQILRIGTRLVLPIIKE